MNPTTGAGLRWVRIGARSLHIVAVCGLAGGVFWGVEAERLGPWWLGAAITGLVMGATFSTGGLGWLLELRGLSLLLKLGLLGLAAALPGAASSLLVVVILLAGITSHMPGRYRYRVPWSPPDER